MKERTRKKAPLPCHFSSPHGNLSVKERLGGLVAQGQVHGCENRQLLREGGSQDRRQGVREGVVWQRTQQTLRREREREII